MIFLKRWHRLARSRLCSLLLCTFCSIPHKLSNEGQQAVWAHQIINLIKNPKLPTSFDQESILDQINNLAAPKEKTTFLYEKKDGSYANKEEVMKLMTDGILLNPLVYKQDHIEQAELILDKIKLSQLNRTTLFENQPFIFYPNFLGTSQMFKVLDKKNDKDFVLSGEAGISKSISIIFYIHLSNFLTKYAYQCSKDSQLQKQLQLLQKENLLGQKIYKYWYWSVSPKMTQEGSLLQIKKLILEQTVELNEKDKNSLVSCKGFDDFGDILNKLYPKVIQRRAIVDQANISASFMRRWNYYYQYQGRKVEGDIQNATTEQKVTFQQRKKHIYDVAVKMRRRINFFVTLGSVYGLNSTHAIQKQIVKNKYANFETKSRLSDLAFSFHIKLQDYRIPYKETIIKDIGRIDFWNIVWFQIRRRFKLIEKKNITMDEIKRIYFKAVQKRQVSKYFRFDRLRSHLDAYSDFFKDQATKVQDVNSAFNEIFAQFPQYCFEAQIKQLERALSKFIPWQLDLLYILQDLSSQMVIVKDQKDQQATFDLQRFSEFFFFMNHYTKNLMKDYSQKNAQIMPYYIEKNKMLTFHWTYEELNDLIIYVLFPQVYKQYFSYTSQFLTEHFKQNGGSRGAALEYAIRKALTPNSSLIYCYVNKSGVEVRQHLKIADVLTFIPLNTELAINKGINPTEHFKRNFGSILTSCKAQPNAYFFAQPKYTEDEKEKPSEASKGIDFIIAKYDKSKEKYVIKTYDTTVLDTTSTKVNKFRTDVYSQLNTMILAGGLDPKQFEFEHIVLSLSKSMDVQSCGDLQLPLPATIYLCDIMKLEVQDSSQGEAAKNIRQLQLNCSTLVKNRRLFKKN